MSEQNKQHTDKDEERRKVAIQKAMEHEQQFNKPMDNELFQKRMGADLFK